MVFNYLMFPVRCLLSLNHAGSEHQIILANSTLSRWQEALMQIRSLILHLYLLILHFISYSEWKEVKELPASKMNFILCVIIIVAVLTGKNVWGEFDKSTFILSFQTFELRTFCLFQVVRHRHCQSRHLL